MTIRSPFTPLALLLAATLVGCGNKDDAQKGAKDKPATQVAARVNAEEITVHQINSLLARNRNIPPEAATQAKYEILNRLIEQQLAKQQAIEQKLDRKPNVVQALEAARDEILARAYMETVAAKQPKPSQDEVKKYYEDHPELFAQRRIFNIEELVVEPRDGLAEKLQAQVAKSRSMQEVANWLKEQDFKFAPNRGVRAAESLPLDILPRLQKMKDGEMRAMEVNKRLYVFRVAASKPAPVTEAMATPRIQQYLFNRGASDVVAAEIKRLKAAANIEYVGEFTGGAAAAAEKAKAEAEARAQAEARTKEQLELEAKRKAEIRAQEKAEADARADALSKARREAEAHAKADGKDSKPKAIEVPQGTIDKGIRGLK
ncbi:MAG: EpsD family peptidyl-prolyl cis-trans isomerase [Steroidobacteraceae bacterium]